MKTHSWVTVICGRARGVGKTRAMAEACKKLGGTMVCVNVQHADAVIREYGIDAVSVASPGRLRGQSGPVLFDPDAVVALSADYDAVVAELEADLRAAREEAAAIRDHAMEALDRAAEGIAGPGVLFVNVADFREYIAEVPTAPAPRRFTLEEIEAAYWKAFEAHADPDLYDLRDALSGTEP